MRPERVPADHHWLALWLLIVGGVWLCTYAGSIDPGSAFDGILIGAGFVWLMLVD